MTQPILPAEPAELAHRWDARASSVQEVEAQLTKMWSAAAEEATETGMTPSAAADALGDPRVARHVPASGNVRVRARTRVLTLVVVADRPETAERAMEAVNLLAGRHPSRALIVAPGDPDGPPSLDARLHLSCTVRPDSMTETCAERVLLHCGGEVAQHLAGVVTPLLIHDLPVVLWWTDDPPIGTRQFRELVGTCEQLLVDCGTFRDDGSSRLAGLTAVMAAGETAVRDIGWMRLTLWRELLAGLFDHPLLTPELASVRSVRIDVLRPGSTLRVAKAACFAGWLASTLGWQVARPLEQKRGSESLVASWLNGRHEVRLELRPVSPLATPGLRSSGSLQRVEIEIARGQRTIRARVTRQADHLLATADWDGAEVARRAGQLEPFDEAPYVADSLDRMGHDRVYEAAALQAARLVG